MPEYCDYFEVSKGYRFSALKNGNGAGLVYLEDRSGSARDLYYKGLTRNPKALYWEWDELADLIDDYKGYPVCEFNQTEDNSTIPSGNTSVPTNETLPYTQGAAVWKLLPLQWSAWNTTAQEGSGVASWSKQELKYWLKSYINFYDILQLYKATQYEQPPIIDMPEGSTGSAPPVYGTIIADNNSTIVDNSSVDANLTVVTDEGFVIEFLSFTDFWAPEYDNENVTVAQIIEDLRSASTIYEQTLEWFVGYFGPAGYVTLDTVYSPGTVVPTTPIESINVPEGLEAIVAWLEAHVEAEIKRRCP